MKTFYSALLLLAAFYCTPASAINYTDKGTNTTYSLTKGDTLNIISGTYTGSITNFANLAVVNVDATATFNPLTIPASAAGTVNVYGKANFNADTYKSTRGAIYLNNWGTVTGVTFHAGGGKIVNNSGTISIQSLTFSGTIENYSTINISGTLTAEGSAFVTNGVGAKLYTGAMSMTGTNFTNDGYVYATGLVSTSGGGFQLYNNCSFVTSGGIRHGQGIIKNNKFLLILDKDFINLAEVVNGLDAHLQGVNFSNGTATVKGSGISVKGGGNIRFTGSTATYASFGDDGFINGNHLNFYDVSPTNNQIMDILNRSVHASVTKQPVTAIDTFTAKNSCASDFRVSTMPVKLLSFTVQPVENNKAFVKWKVTEEIALSHYEVEYSTDGKTFYKKDIVQPSATENMEITYSSNLNLSGSNTHYFRIKIVNLNKTVQYSPLRILQQDKVLPVFSIENNPAKTQTSLHFYTTEKKSITISLTNSSGQAIDKKQITISKIDNVFQYINLDQYQPGIYYVTVTCNDGKQQTLKLLIL